VRREAREELDQIERASPELFDPHMNRMLGKFAHAHAAARGA
jgi:hypothetical protein